MVDSALDAAIRRAAFDHLRALSAGRDYVTSEELARGFEFNGERIPLGIDMDFKIHIAPQLLAQKDGPILEAIKSVNGQQIRLPARKADFPDRDRLEMRFLKFKAAALNSN